jgi:hypothetical protein
MQVIRRNARALQGEAVALRAAKIWRGRKQECECVIGRAQTPNGTARLQHSGCSANVSFLLSELASQDLSWLYARARSRRMGWADTVMMKLSANPWAMFICRALLRRNNVCGVGTAKIASNHADQESTLPSPQWQVTSQWYKIRFLWMLSCIDPFDGGNIALMLLYNLVSVEYAPVTSDLMA